MRAARADHNQPAIVKYARDQGITVQHLHTVGKGCPDVVFGYLGFNFLVEIKDPEKPPSAQRLTKDESKWHQEWGGEVSIVKTNEDVDEIKVRAKAMANMMAALIFGMKPGREYRLDEINMVGRNINNEEKYKMLEMLIKQKIVVEKSGLYKRVK